MHVRLAICYGIKKKEEEKICQPQYVLLSGSTNKSQPNPSQMRQGDDDDFDDSREGQVQRMCKTIICESHWERTFISTSNFCEILFKI